jgi:multidrug transporter EmrE-like cation transporter
LTESAASGWQLVRSFAVVLFVLAVLGAGIYGLVVALDHLRSGVAAGVLTGSASVLIAVFTFVGSQRADRRRMIEQSVRERKLPLYTS